MDVGPQAAVSFLFTDIEGSTALWERHPAAMLTAYQRHDAILHTATVDHGGVVFKVIGDAVQAAFPTALDAIATALDAQRALFAEPWPLPQPLRVRMAIHTCPIEPKNGDYRGPGLNRLGRLLVVGHGGQVLLTRAVADLAGDGLPPGIAFRDLGERRLKDLPGLERIYQLTAVDLPESFAPLRTLDPRFHDLPIPPSPLIGREEEVRTARTWLEHGKTRLLTLTGPGGVGKTRLAVAVANGLVDVYVGGVRFVPLAAISNPVLTASAIATRLGIRAEPDRSLSDTLVASMQDQELLLVLDNFEQIVEAAPLVAELLAAVPGLRVLVTSRTRLRVRPERVLSVSPLMVPDPLQARRVADIAEVPASALFLERVMSGQPGYVLADADATSVAEICVRLDGLPLAIELAAARLDTFTPQELSARLTRRLPELIDGPRDLPDRQRTLRETIAWSYHLLSTEERVLLRRMAVFTGGWTAATADPVARSSTLPFPNAKAVQAGLSALAEHSLLRRATSPEAEPRFAMFEMIREYALEQLSASGEETITRSAHARYFLNVAEEAEQGLYGPDEPIWLDRLEIEHDNLRAALEWTRNSKQAEIGLRLAARMWRFWYVRGHLEEGQNWLERTLTDTCAIASIPRVRALNGLAVLVHHGGDPERGLVLNETSLIMAEELDDVLGQVRAMNDLAVTAAAVYRDFERARGLLHGALARARQIDARWWIANGLNNLGSIEVELGNLEAAAHLFDDALQVARDNGLLRLVATIVHGQGEVAEAQHDFATAANAYGESLKEFHRLGSNQDLMYELSGLARVAVAAGRQHQGARLFGVAAARAAAFGALLIPPDEQRRNDQAVATARQSLGDTAYLDSWEDGRSLSIEDIATDALAPANELRAEVPYV